MLSSIVTSSGWFCWKPEAWSFPWRQLCSFVKHTLSILCVRGTAGTADEWVRKYGHYGIGVRRRSQHQWNRIRSLEIDPIPYDSVWQEGKVIHWRKESLLQMVLKQLSVHMGKWASTHWSYAQPSLGWIIDCWNWEGDNMELWVRKVS